LIQNVFPVHDQNELKNLEKLWYQKIEAYLPFRNIPTSKRNKYTLAWITLIILKLALLHFKIRLEITLEKAFRFTLRFLNTIQRVYFYLPQLV